ncbi:MAG TPA: hypothetical protein VJJ22_01430 [Candidatus Paceibacterota bacterium]
MQKNNNPNRLLVILAIVNLLAIAIWLAIFFFSQKLEASINDVISKLALEDAKGNYLATTAGDLRVTEEGRQIMNQSFIKLGDEASFLENIESLATSTKIEMSVSSFEKVDKTLHLVMQTKGSFARNYYFLSLLESLPYEMKINKATLSTNPGDIESGWSGRYDITISSYLDK